MSAAQGPTFPRRTLRLVRARIGRAKVSSDGFWYAVAERPGTAGGRPKAKYGSAETAGGDPQVTCGGPEMSYGGP